MTICQMGRLENELSGQEYFPRIFHHCWFKRSEQSSPGKFRIPVKHPGKNVEKALPWSFSTST